MRLFPVDMICFRSIDGWGVVTGWEQLSGACWLLSMYRCHKAKTSQQAAAIHWLSALAEAVHWQLGLQPLPDGAGQNCPGQSQWQVMHYEGTQKADLFLFLANKRHDIPGEKQWFSSPSQALERPDFQEHGVHKTAAPCQQRIHPAKVNYNCCFPSAKQHFLQETERVEKDASQGCITKVLRNFEIHNPWGTFDFNHSFDHIAREMHKNILHLLSLALLLFPDPVWGSITLKGDLNFMDDNPAWTQQSFKIIDLI